MAKYVYFVYVDAYVYRVTVVIDDHEHMDVYCLFMMCITI